MNRILRSALVFGGVFLVMACDFPGSPDFNTSHKMEIPFLNNKTFVFLGDSTGALIDSTSEDFDSLFTIGGDGLISISNEETFEFGDLNDAIPAIDGSTTSFNSEVGEIQVGSFSSGGGDLGSTDFATISGAAEPPEGTPVPAGNNSATPVNIDIGANSDFFTSATISSGALELTVTNNLGFDIQTLDITLLSSGAQVGTTASFGLITSGSTGSASVVFSNGDALSNISVDVVISWDGFTYPATSGDLIVNSAEGVSLFASSVTANVPAQDFSTSSTSTFSDTEFQFTNASHYVQLSGGSLSIANFTNNMGIGIDTLQISFPGILNDDFGAEDSLVIQYLNIGSGTSPADQNIDLSNYRIYALNNQVTYNIVAVTENTQSGGAAAVTLSQTDNITASVDISGLTVGSAFGIVLSQQVTLGDDDPSNGTDVVDVYNDLEVELTEIDGLDSFSDQFDGLEFTNPKISINYSTNIGIETSVYAVLLGSNSDGEIVYLTGKPGSSYEVQAGDPVTGIFENGIQVPTTNMIKFDITPAAGGMTATGSIEFDSTTTNVTDFLNNLPNEIRFVGKAVVNQSEAEGTIATPLNFDPSFSIDLPLQFMTSTAATFTDTLEVDMADLPSQEKGDESYIKSGQFYLAYTNNLPLGLDLELTFLDSTNTPIPGLSLPISGESLSMVASPIDPVTKFSTGAIEQSLVFSLSESQLPILYRARNIEVTASMNTTSNEEVKLRASDSVILSFGAKITIANSVGGN